MLNSYSSEKQAKSHGKDEYRSLVENEEREIRVGDHPGDGFRYLRLFFEIPLEGSTQDWCTYQKGGYTLPITVTSILLLTGTLPDNPIKVFLVVLDVPPKDHLITNTSSVLG